ncbi:DUF1080 domain-containing protein [Roseivirga sp. BDSF3-8]|uniref:3-keto-disaccharide hydrolase n=1 Tax=Roseivirga sp. BDSF3-8 TaxID=3241598 RepID=UPI003531D9B5
MKRLLFLLLPLFYSCAEKEEQWTSLLDKDMSQWQSYLSYRHQNEYNGEQPVDSAGNVIQPIGVDSDSFNVFSVIEENNELLLRVSGEIYGCVYSKEVFENYHLRLQYRWGQKKWVPRLDKLKDSGILYHSIGPHGAEHWRTWMLSQELQIMEGHTGDYWSQATSAIDIRAFIPEYIMNPVADTSQAFLPLGTEETIPGFCLRSANYEKPEGEWNTVELICYEDKSVHIVNGQVVMVLANSRYVKDGKKIPLVRGRIQLQSEAAEVFYKDITIRPLASLPAEYVQLFN